jgi:HAD superfamily hydrolase (TIGR01484 family)
MELIRAEKLGGVRLVATDMDGTLTIAGKFTAELLRSFEKLTDASIEILIVTGRSAGWVSGLANYLPISGAIAENGGLFYAGDHQTLLTPISDVKRHRQELNEMFDRLQTKFPHIQQSSDNPFRCTDWTFDVSGLDVSDLDQMNSLCQSQGWDFTYSNVQCHILPANQNKAKGLLDVLKTHFPQYTVAQILTVGDSPNDESLFDANLFPRSIGVANIRHYQSHLSHLPTYVTSSPEGSGFSELADALFPSL